MRQVATDEDGRTFEIETRIMWEVIDGKLVHTYIGVSAAIDGCVVPHSTDPGKDPNWGWPTAHEAREALARAARGRLTWITD